MLRNLKQCNFFKIYILLKVTSFEKFLIGSLNLWKKQKKMKTGVLIKLLIMSIIV